MIQEARIAQDTRSLDEGIESLRGHGFIGDFIRQAQGFRFAPSGKFYRPEELTIVDHLRFEGASDPAEMAVVYAIESDQGDRGVIVDAFGTYADPSLGSVMERMRMGEDASVMTH